MQKSCNTEIKAPGFALSGAVGTYLALIYLGLMWALMIILIPLGHFFPFLKKYNPYTILTILYIIIILWHIPCYYYTVILEPNMVTLKCFGIPVRRIPVTRFKTFCAVGNGREDILCLSCYSVSEMADMQERRLLRNFFSKHEVPFRKRNADWKDSFAREYLNCLRKNPFPTFKERDIVMLEMHPALQYAIRQMYPQLPYMNYTGVSLNQVPKYDGIRENRAVCFPLHFYDYDAHIQLDGIHICNKNDEIIFIPAEQIKTIVRVDIFKRYEKYHPHHIPLLFVTCMTEEALAEQPTSVGYAGIYPGNTDNQTLRAMTAATYLALHWNKDHTDCCIVPHTENNLNALRTLYPHIQINEIAATWLEDSVAPPAAK